MSSPEEDYIAYTLANAYFDEGYFDDEDPDDEYVACSICSCLIGDEVAYGDTWDGRQVCAGCAGIEEEDGSEDEGFDSDDD